VGAPSGAEGPLGPSRQGSVVLDIGPHAGALVVYTPAGLAGAEIELRPAGGTWQGHHTAVRRRDVPGHRCHAGVFGSLPPGPYELRVRHDPGTWPVLGAEVVAGAVGELTFVAGGAPAAP